MAWCGHAAVVVAMGDLMMRCVWRSVRCGTKGETRVGTRVGTRDAPFLSAQFGRSHVAIDRRGPLGELSAFSTVSKYNTQDGRRMMSSDGIHNTNTNRNGFHYIELMFGVRA